MCVLVAVQEHPSCSGLFASKTMELNHLGVQSGGRNLFPLIVGLARMFILRKSCGCGSHILSRVFDVRNIIHLNVYECVVCAVYKKIWKIHGSQTLALLMQLVFKIRKRLLIFQR